MASVSITFTRKGNVFTVTPGKARAAAINLAIEQASALSAALDSEPRLVQLVSGTYELESAIIMRTGVVLRGEGPQTVLKPTFTGAADDPTNAVIKADGAIDTTVMNTSLTAQAGKRSSTIPVAAAGTIAANQYILIQGNNGAEDALLESSGASVILSEVVRVASSYAGGLSIPLAWPTRQHHGTGAVGVTVRAVTPVRLVAVESLRIRGCEDGVTTAVGLFARYALGVDIRGVHVSGMTRAAIEMNGVKRFTIQGFRSRGALNNWLHLISCCDGTVYEYSGDDGVARVNAAGYPRYPILLRSRCTNVVVRDGELNGVAAGMYLAGGEHITFRGLTIRDVKITDSDYTRMIASGEIQNDQASIIMGLGAGYGPLNLAEFGFDVTWDDIRIEDLEAPASGAWVTGPYKARAVYFHDILRAQASNISIVNRGSESYVSGMTISDVGGLVSNVLINGYGYGLITENVTTHLEWNGLFWNGVRGVSPNAQYPLFLNYHGSNGHNLRICGLRTGNGFSGARFGSSFLSEGFVYDGGLTIEDYASDEGRWSRVVLAYNNTGVAFQVGDIVEIDPTYTGDGIRVRTPVTDGSAIGWEYRLAVVCNGGPSDIGTAWIFICPLPAEQATVKATTAAVNYGDAIEYAIGTDRRARADSAVDGATRIGRSHTRKTAGAEGMITIGVIPG